jgi:hypothetical protein
MQQSKNKIFSENSFLDNNINFLKNSEIGPRFGPRPVGVIGYPESLAKSYSEKPKQVEKEQIGLVNNDQQFEKYIREKAPKENPDKVYKCSKGFLWGTTSKSNYYKIVTCGKEWCSDCGAFHSISHSRRINKVLPRIRGLLFGGKRANCNRAGFINGQTMLGQSIQYLVITVPPSLRDLFRDQEVLNRFRNYWRRKLKEEGREHGVCRYHWAGEDGYLWHPHLNILTTGEFIPMQTLIRWRAELGQWFKNEFNLKHKPTANIYTSYSMDEKKIKHRVSYVFRATQTIYNKWNEETIKGFRNTATITLSSISIWGILRSYYFFFRHLHIIFRGHIFVGRHI